jgi:hypothetical protein
MLKLLPLLLLLAACGPFPDNITNLTDAQFRTKCTNTIIERRDELKTIPSFYKLYATNVSASPLRPTYSRYVGLALAYNLSPTQLDVYFGDCTETKNDGAFNLFIQGKSAVTNQLDFDKDYFLIGNN